MSLLSKILQAVLEVALPILVSAAAAWAVGKAKEIFRKLKDENPDTYYVLSMIVEKAVDAAEQIYTGGGRGQEKKEYVINLIENYFRLRGIELDVHIIDAYIEAEVYRMNLFKKEEAENADLPPAVQ